jgi:hypothetical protein
MGGGLQKDGIRLTDLWNIDRQRRWFSLCAGTKKQDWNQ